MPRECPQATCSNASAFAQGAENDNTADGKQYDGGQRGDQHEVWVQVKDVGEDRRDSENDSQEVGQK